MAEKIIQTIVDNCKQQLSKYVDELIINLDLSTFSKINKKIQDIIEADNNLEKLYQDIKKEHSMYEMDIKSIKSIKLENENQDKDIDALNNTFIKESYFVTDPNNIKKTLGYNDSSIRIGFNKIQDWDGDINSKYKNLKGNIGIGHNVNGSLVPDEKFSEISNIRNISIGTGSLGFNTKGNYNSFLGHNAAIYSENGSANTGVGYTALMDNKNGSYNTALGSGAGTINEGSYNTYLGRWSGRPIDGKTLVKFDWTTCVGSGTAATNSNQVILGTDKEYVYSGFPIHITTSDESYQQNVVDSNLGLEFIKKLRPIEFELANNSSEKDPRKHLGLSANDVKKAMDELGIDYAFYQDHTKTGGLARKTVSYEELFFPMIKALQELEKKIKDLESSFQERINKLESKIVSLDQLNTFRKL